MNICNICYEENYINSKCLNCKFISCKTCIITYKKPECCQCNKSIDNKFIKSIFTQKYINDVYIKYYVEKKIILLTKQNIEDYLIEQKNKKLLRFGIQINNIDIKEKHYILKCPQIDCKGYINNNYICLLCNTNICDKCEEIIINEHKCDAITLSTINLIKSKSKKCPYCYTYIEKTFGCNDIKCTYCGASFNWRTLELQTKLINEEHYTTIINNEMNEEYQKMMSKIINKTKHINREIYIFDDNQISNFYIICTKQQNQLLKKLRDIEITYLNNKNNINLKKLYKYYKKLDYIYEIIHRLQSSDLINLLLLEEYLNYLNNDFIFPKDILYIVHNNVIIKKNILQKTSKNIISIKSKLSINSDQIKKITLIDEEQIIHAKNIHDKLITYKKALDISYAGSGKTYISLYVSKELNLTKIIVLCPKILVNKWNVTIDEYNSYNQFDYDIISYNSLITKKDYSNDLFDITYIYKQNYIEYVFKPKLKILKIFDEKTILIIDEMHTVRNTGNMYNIICNIANVAKMNNSYILNLSATPIEKKNQIPLILNKFGFLKKKNYKISIFQEIIEKLPINDLLINNIIEQLELSTKLIFPKKFYTKLSTYKTYPENTFENYLLKLLYTHCTNLVYNFDILIDIINKHFSMFESLAINSITYNLAVIDNIGLSKCYLANYDLTEKDKKCIEYAFKNIDYESNKPFICLGLVTKGLMQTETVYIKYIYQIIKNVLESYKNIKIIIGLNYLSCINDLSELLKEENHLVVTGKTINNIKNINLFQEDNNNYKILIVSTTLLNTGIDLDDKTGNYNRFVIFSPNFISINMYQFIHRFYRKDSKSIPIIHILNNHHKIIENLTYKAKLQKQINLNLQTINEFKEWNQSLEKIFF